MEEGTDKGIGRRQVLAGFGGTAAALAIGATSARAQTGAEGGGDEPLELDLDAIQGNIVAGFNKDHQAFVLISLPDAAAGRAWLESVTPLVASSSEVEAFNAEFRAAVAEGGEDSAPTATWVNVALSHTGLANLERPAAELDEFPRAFRAGMAARARRVGDTGTSAPSTWPSPYQEAIDAVVIVAADRPEDLDDEIERQEALAATAGVEVVLVERGDTRADEPGHEHFGFRDGVSQPGLRGFTEPQNPDDPDQGIPGQDLLWPGEFVLGYPRQAGVGGGDEPGPISRSGPDWTENGSYFVFRRLRQDVPGFHAFIAETADERGMSEDLAGAKIVGRYKSGAPLEVTGPEAIDPGKDDPALLEEAVVNDFEFEDDFDGALVPLGAHIRKTYPRDQPTDDGGEEDTQLHRLLRRGIPFGSSYVDGTSDPEPSYPDDRGLIFGAYQWSIERQFEHVQRRWVNDPDFPEEDTGQDPVIAQSPDTGSFTMPGGRPDHVALMQRFVTTTGGEYFFQPSLPALTELTRVATDNDSPTDNDNPGGTDDPGRTGGQDGRPGRGPRPARNGRRRPAPRDDGPAPRLGRRRP